MRNYCFDFDFDLYFPIDCFHYLDTDLYNNLELLILVGLRMTVKVKL